MSSWYYNSNSGAVMQSNELLMYIELHSGTGWHGPFTTQDEANKFYQDNKAANPGWKAPTGLLGQAGNITGVTGVGDSVSKALDPLGSLNLTNWFIRIAEIVLGLLLIGIGVSKVTGAKDLIPKVIPV